MDKIVSFDSEQLILVDKDDNPIGNKTKDECHDGQGILHRAFSLFILNNAGELLLQQRSAQKRLWPLYWTNSCCSHPRQGETMEVAIERRLYQELHIASDLKFLYKFIYHAHFADAGSEHELCHVYIGKSSDTVTANSNEIADWRFVAPSALNAEISSNPAQFTPWFKLEWEHIKQNFSDELV